MNRLMLDGPRLDDFFAVLDTTPAVRDRPQATDPGRLRGLVEFQDVCFSYDGRRPAVTDLRSTAPPGATIALVGPTGAGKSTAVSLLHRVFDPQSGAVTIDGVDIRDFTLASLRRNIGVVFQFEDGHVVEEGTFDELTHLQGRFAALAKAQFMTAEPEPAERRTGSG